MPVLLQPVLDVLQPHDGDIIIDGTFGAGGYTRALLKVPGVRVIAIDRDPSAIAAGQALVDESQGWLSLVEGRFSEMEDIAAKAGLGAVNGIVLDVGVSSMQLDEAGRGFSFMRDGPLDMRMAQAGRSAAEVVNSLEERDLRHVIAVLGEEKRAYAIAKAIVARRASEPFSRTLELANLIEQTIGRPPKSKGPSIHPATRTFQALRIFVNAELQELAEALAAAERLLAPGGQACGGDVSFAGGPHRQAVPAGANRPGAEGLAPCAGHRRHRTVVRRPGTRRHRGGRGGDGCQSTCPFGQTEGRTAHCSARASIPSGRVRQGGVPMLRLLNFMLVAGVLASGFALYTLEHNTRALERQIAAAEKATESEYEMIGLLDAEWSLLTRPQRLEQLARHHLNMVPLLPDQIKRPEEITGSLPPAPAAAPDETPASEDPLADLLRMMQ